MSRLDETLAMDRRRFLRAAAAGGALLAVGGSLVVPRLFAADATPVGSIPKPARARHDAGRVQKAR